MESFDITKIYEALDVNKEGFINLEVVQSFIEEFQRSSPDSQHLDNFNTILLRKAHSDGRLYMEDFEAAVQELQAMDCPKSPGLQLTSSDSLELRSSQETLVDPGPGVMTASWPGVGVSPQMHKSPSQLSKDDSNDTHSDSGVHDCVISLDQIIAENEDSPITSPRGSNHVSGNSFGGVPPESTDIEESYEDYGESENDFSLRNVDQGLIGVPTADVGRRSPAGRLLKPPPHPGTSYAGPWTGQQSASRQAHDLYSTSLNGSPYSSYSEGLCPEVSGAQLDDLQGQLAVLANQVTKLSSSQAESNLHNHKLLESNNLMRRQISSLEDQLKDVENRSVGNLDTEKRSLREKMDRIDRDRNEELSSLRSRLHNLETESAEARLEAMKFKTEAERLKLEKLRAEEKLLSAEDQIRSLNDDRSRYIDIHKRELECVKRERDHYHHLVEDLSRQQEEGRQRPGSVHSAANSDVSERFKEAQELVKRLTSENKAMREQLEETQAELLTRTLEQGKSLMQRSESSLAAELDNCTKDELLQILQLEIEQDIGASTCNCEADCPHIRVRKKLMEILVKEKDANQKLRGYIDNILTRIIEQNPSMLEVCVMQQPC